MFADELKRAIEVAPQITLPAVAALLWKAYGDGKVSEAEAEVLSAMIEARSHLPKPKRNSCCAALDNEPNPENMPLRNRGGSRPRTDASMGRRRRWAASGRLPPTIAARFTLAEQAVLAVIATETAKRGDCRLCHEHVAAVAGVSRSSVKATLRQARTLGLITIEERRLSRHRNDTNIVRIISAEWTTWLRLARSGDTARGGGVKSATRTNTPVSYPVNLEGRKGQKGCRGTMIERTGRALPPSS
ncbi:helix-turn-helix domain-containing protein [Methylobacterium sp. WL122]|nr:helix-turn-helix domain-containing protein [Methylobacterium sp. WL122]